jgi:hypothetical protein
MDRPMTTHFISAEVDLHDTAEQLHSALKLNCKSTGNPCGGQSQTWMSIGKRLW